MGIRSMERRLAPELCYEAVAEAVHAYVEESRQAGRLLWPHEHLVVPIIRAGYYPPGLLSVKHFISRRQQEMARPQGRDAGCKVLHSSHPRAATRGHGAPPSQRLRRRR